MARLVRPLPLRIALCNITDVAEQGRVIVIGAGIVGAAIARSLVRSGTEVVVLDRGPSAGGTSSGGEGNLLVSDKGPGPELELMQRSIQLWSEIGPQLRDELPAGFPGLELEHKGGWWSRPPRPVPSGWGGSPCSSALPVWWPRRWEPTGCVNSSPI